jgi:phenylacetate-coenzyme A ligase PaaK-like adenylate-forming protein
MKTAEDNADRCTVVLEQALSDVPFYKKWREFDTGPAYPLAKRMAALPVLTKKDLRAHVPHGFIHKDFNYRRGFASRGIEMVSTSGTTGDRGSVVWNQKWWGRSEREAARLHPALDRIYSHDHHEAVLTTPVCAGNLCHIGDSPMKERIAGNLLFLNQSPDPTSWSNRDLRRMVEELDLFQPEIIEADPAYLAILSRACLQAGDAIYQPECIVLTYEFPSQIYYRQIHRAFPGVPVISSYGSTETGHVFTQCEAGAFHQNTATCHVDIQPLRLKRGNPGIGRILVTTLDNPWFVLLHFDTGDLALLSEAVACPCGCSEGLAVKSIEGRTSDLTFSAKGQVVTLKQLDDALKAAEGLNSYQLEQSGPQRYTILYTTGPEENRRMSDLLMEILQTLYGPGSEIETQRVAAIPPDQSGKFRPARSTWRDQPGDIFL